MAPRTATSASVRRLRLNGGQDPISDLEGEELFHELVQLRAIVRIGWLQTGVVHDQDGMGAPLPPAIHTHLLPDRLAELPGDGRLGERRRTLSAANAGYFFDIRHFVPRR